MANQADETMSHTPGPWCVETVFGKALVDICLDREIPGAGSPVPIATCFHDAEGDTPPLMDVAEAEANARLMAAAPDLLEALKLLVHETKAAGNWDARDYGWPKVRAAVTAAIAKAECASRDH